MCAQVGKQGRIDSILQPVQYGPETQEMEEVTASAR
jgi:hypothetical protein